MISLPEKPSIEEETTFDTFEIDNQIFKNGEYIQKTKDKNPKIKDKFKLLEGLNEEELKQKDENSDFPKYFSQITTAQFIYIGVLSNQLKRVQYGYSKMQHDDQYFGEYLGEYKNEIKDGFGIYKFRPNDEDQDIYIGEYKNDSKTGYGLYLKIFKFIEDESTGKPILINFSCGIGEFENDTFKKGKIFTVQNDVETLYKGKINELGVPSDNEGLILEGKDKIFVGKIINGEMIEGRNIFVGENYEKNKAYYFTKTNNINTPYNFDLNKNEEKDEENIKMVKESSFGNYKNQIINIFNDVNSSFDKFKKFDNAIKVDFENDIKNTIKTSVDKIIKD